MKKLLVLLVLLAVVWAIGEIVALRFAESRIEAETTERSVGAVEVAADIDSFPFATRLLLTERVEHLSVTLEEVAQLGVRFSTVRFELDGLLLDRSALFRRSVRAKGFDTGTVTAEIDVDALASVLGASLNVGEVEVTAEGRSLLLSQAGATIGTVPLPADLMPCEPTAEVLEGTVRLSCTIEDVPPLLEALFAGSSG